MDTAPMMPTATDSITRDRSKAAFLAAAIGDALGWPMEDRGNRVGGTAKVKPAPRLVPWSRREGGGYAPHEQSIPAGTYSDDTQMLLAVGRSRLRGPDWYRHLIEAELPVWLLYERGGGGALKRSARSWSTGRPPWDLNHKRDAVVAYFRAGGNGAAMRCLPHVLVDRDAKRFDQIAEFLDADGLATHGHPRALVGARALAWGVWWTLNRTSSLGYGELLERTIEAAPEWAGLPRPPADWTEAMTQAASGWPEEWDMAVEEMLRYLSIARNGLAHGAVAVDGETLEQIGMFGKERGAGTVSAAAAIFLATRYTSQPLQGLLSAAFLRNTDSDTVASMTGALLGGLAGADWLGELTRQIQDGGYLEEMADWLAVGEGPEVPSLRWEPSIRTSLYRRLEVSMPGDRMELPIFGAAQITQIDDYETKSRINFIRSWSFKTELGQSLTVKRYDKGKEGIPRWEGRYPQQSNGAGGGEPKESVRPKTSARRRVGLVREVHDLTIACRFYEQIVGLKRERSTQNTVSFGWLALELCPGARAEQLSLPSAKELEESRQSIRIYVDAGDLGRRHQEVVASGLQVGPVEEAASGNRFRCADPDGYVVEFRSHSSGG